MGRAKSSSRLCRRQEYNWHHPEIVGLSAPAMPIGSTHREDIIHGVNRRNYYRILHLQPEAPGPVISASYRTMMSMLRLHPDLGGDTAGAALINEADAVLSDPVRRAKYDLQLRAPKAGGRHRSCAAAAAATHEPDAPAACPFCRASAPAAIQAKTRCHRCDSPLAPPPARPLGKNELFGRRAMPRMSRSDPVTLVAGWQTPVRTAQLRDLSMTGVSVITDVKIERQQVIRIIGPLFDILATVVGCRSDGRRVEVRASLLNAILMKQKGVVVSVKTQRTASMPPARSASAGPRTLYLLAKSVRIGDVLEAKTRKFKRTRLQGSGMRYGSPAGSDQQASLARPRHE
jgi:DnaJ domain